MIVTVRGKLHWGIGSLFALVFLPQVYAIDLVADTALGLAPKDCDIYASSFQLKEQFRALMQSPVVQELHRVPYIAKLIELAKEQWEQEEGQIGQARQFIENPSVAALIELGQEMVSDEIFMLADGQLSEMVIRMADLSAEINSVMVQSSDPQALKEYLLNLPKTEFDSIPIPTLVLGFKVRDQEKILSLLDQVQMVSKFGLGGVPEAQGFVEGLQRVEDKRGTRLVWTIVEGMVPWQMIEDRGEAFPEAIDKIREILKDRQLSLTFGQLDDYLVIALSEEPSAILDLGENGSLWERPEMAPVRSRATENMVSIAYLSDAYADAYFQSQLKDFFQRQLSPLFRRAESEFGDEFPPEFRTIPEDLEWLDQQIGDLVPPFRGQTAFSFLTATGSETWAYARTEQRVFDGAKSLDILQHVGGDPLALIAFRFQDRPEYFATARRIVQRIKEYLDLVPGLDGLDQDTLDKWDVLLNRAWPLLVEAANLWEEGFQPALRDGQHAWVLSAGNLSSTQWWDEMPPSKEPLPLPSAAFIAGLSDKEKMSNAWRDLFDHFDRWVALVREEEPESVPPDYSVPRPKKAESNAGDRYLYPIPKEARLPASIAPQALLTERFMISSYSEDFSSSLAKPTPLAVAPDLLDAKQPCMAVAHFDLGRICVFLQPWVVYGIESTIGSVEATIQEEDGFPPLHGSDVLDIWKALGSAGTLTSITTLQAEEDGTVTRTVFAP